MPGRVPIDPFVSLQQVDHNFHSEGEIDEGEATQHNLYIPRSKHQKSKNRRRHSDTIWTIVHEQENLSSAKTLKINKSGTKERSKSKESSSKHKKSKENKKGQKSPATKSENQRRSSFLDNPIFETELKNWTLPRVELWCRDPSCQINADLWRDYCNSHQDQLTQLQVQELQQQHKHRHHHHHPDRSQPHPPTSRSQRLSSISSAYHLFDDSVDNSQSVVPQVGLCNESGAGAVVHGAHSLTTQHECRHPFHHQNQEEEHYYVHSRRRPTNHGNMHFTMSIGASMNNLSAQDAAKASSLSAGGGTYSSPQNGPNNRALYNNINHSHPPPTSSSVIISVPSGASSNNTSNSKSAKTTSTIVSVGQHHQVTTNSTGGEAGGGSSRASEFHQSLSASSSSSSSSSASATDVSSGSTFVTGFDSSESRTSSVPSSLSKPPHPNIIMESGTHHHRESNSYNNNSNTNNNKLVSQQNSDHLGGFGDRSNGPEEGYPSLPYIPSGYRKPGICPSCNGLVPTPTNPHLVPVDPIISSGVNADGPLQHKSDNAFWNFTKFQHPLQRDHSFHSVGGFTLNGQYNTQVKKRRMVKFCSSHKIALVVSTFSLMVTVGLIITLILMKKRGMMDTMDMMPT